MVTVLKIERVKKGIKQYELANTLGIRSSDLSMYETGRSKPHVELRYRIAKALDLPKDVLFPEEA